MGLRPQDIVVACYLASRPDRPVHAGRVWHATLLGQTEVYASLKRLKASRLAGASTGRVNPRNLHDFLVHGAVYQFYPELGAPARGLPTAHAAPVLVEHLSSSGQALVWADPAGEVLGTTLKPLYKTVPRPAAEIGVSTICWPSSTPCDAVFRGSDAWPRAC